jgi:hypothetical protein
MPIVTFGILSGFVLGHGDARHEENACKIE